MYREAVNVNFMVTRKQKLVVYVQKIIRNECKYGTMNQVIKPQGKRGRKEERGTTKQPESS